MAANFDFFLSRIKFYCFFFNFTLNNDNLDLCAFWYHDTKRVFH